MSKKVKAYKTQTFLNDKDISSTGNIVCYSGVDAWDRGTTMFVSVSDCHVSARIHKSSNESKKHFIKKLKRMQKDIEKFISHLEEDK